MMRGFYLLAMRKRRQKRLAALSCVLAALSAVFAIGTYNSKTDEIPEPVPVSAEKAVDEPFVASAKNGRVVIFRGNELIMRTDIDVRTLPQADQLKLENGVTLDDEESLARLLEDYAS